MRIARTRAAVLALAVTCLCGCTGTAPPAPAPAGADAAAVDAAARAILAAWTAAHPTSAARALLPTGALLTQIGEWTQGPDPEAAKLAFTDGLIEVPAGVPVTGSPHAVVRWDDGVTAPAEPLTPAASLRQATTGSAATPPEPPALVVSAVTASTVRIDTAQGPATVPAWDLRLRTTPVHAVVVAAQVSSRPGASAPRAAPGSAIADAVVRVDAAQAGNDGRALTLDFVGAPDPATVLCGEDYTAEVVENDAAIVVAVLPHPYTGPTPDVQDGSTFGCPALGAARQASVTLSTPWGGRTILDVATAAPVPVA